jgi:ABC-type antimicrobial peptide transport system permease subunit
MSNMTNGDPEDDEFIWNDDDVKVDGIVCWFLGAILITTLAIISMVIASIFHLTMQEGLVVAILVAIVPYFIGRFFYVVVLDGDVNPLD